MNLNGIESLNYPDWYLVEKEVSRTINKLTTLNDLEFYIRNPDEYIRRLAIIRLSELKLKDSISLLKEIIDDSFESSANKELAAWSMKISSLKWNYDLFINNKYFSKFTGAEKLCDIINIIIKDNDLSLNFNFTKSFIDSELSCENDNVRFNDDIVFNNDFLFSVWLKSFSQNTLSNFKENLINFPKKLLKVVKSFSMRSFKIKSFKSKNLHIKRLVPTSQKNDSYRVNYKNSETIIKKFISFSKNTLYSFLYMVLSPIRFIIKKKALVLTLLASLYIFLTFTTPGKIFTFMYFNIEILETQKTIYTSTKDFLSITIKEIGYISGIDIASDNKNSKGDLDSSQISTDDKYCVISKTGLNIRTSPDADSKKLSGTTLPYDTEVTYLSKSENDSMGNLWYLIRSSDGRTGWVYSKLLKKRGG